MNKFQQMYFKALAFLKAFLMVSLLILSVRVNADLSDNLPIALVRQLSVQKIWSVEKDSTNKLEAQEIKRTLQLMKTEKNIEIIVDSLIDTNFSTSNYDAYLVKISILRYFLENKAESNTFGIATAKLLKIENAWQRRYVDSAITLLRQIDLPGYQSTVDGFLEKIKAKKIQISDLSPARRLILNQEIGSSHGVSLMDNSNGKYAVFGFYYEKQQLFSLDFSRPLGETIVTFAHEIIHAADPNLKIYQKDFDAYYPQVKEILKKVLNSSKSDRLTSALISQVFFELGREDLLEKIKEQSKQFLANIQINLANSGNEVTAGDQDILRKWVRAIIGLSIENEYNAYGYSVVVYARLKNQLNIIQSSQDRERFVEAILSGDQQFASRVSQSVNPFQRAYSAYQNMVSKFALSENEKLSLDQSMHLIESIYLDELRVFIGGLNNKFAKLLKEPGMSIVASKSSDSRFLPEWTKAENFDSPANPYSLITARVSTMWAIRVKENILSLVRELSEMRKSLLVLRSGVLDLHDLSFNDFKFLNVVDASEESAGNYQQCVMPHRDYAGGNYEQYQKFFGGQNWNANLTLSENSLPADQLLEKLMKVKLIQSLAWFDKGFPDVKNNIVGAKVFIQKLKEELYDSEDLTRERAFELQKELGDAIEKSSFTGAEVQKIQYLLKVLSSAYKISSERQWNSAAQQFEKKLHQVLRTLNILGVEIEFDAEEFENSWQRTFESFEDQIETYRDDCKGVTATYSAVTQNAINLGDDSFRVNYICSGTEIYFLRLPCDVTDGLSIMTRRGRPMLRPLYNSRFIELIPFSRLSVR